MKKALFIVGLLSAYLALLAPFTAYLRNKPFDEKLGYVPHADVLKPLSADQKQFVAAWFVLKTASYYGGLVQQAQSRIYEPPEYFGMYKTIETALHLDPYNMDGYYFAQAILAWDMKRIHEANALLEHGMKYRDWDFYLPYFAGFNYAYFLKDYAKAAKYYQRVGELTGDALAMRLAGRYMYEAGRTDLAIAYLAAMEKGAQNESIKKTFQIRLKALREVRRIEMAQEQYRHVVKRGPKTVDELLQGGYLQEPPVDPYGGKFYIDKDGVIRSTSKFAFGVHSE